MANLTEYDLSTIRSGSFVEILQSINTMAQGYLGITMLLSIVFVLFAIMSIFGDPKSAFFGSAFAGLLLSFVFLGLGILSPTLFFLFVILVIVVIVIMLK